MRIITDSDGLDALCADLSDAPFLCVDTEFLRDTTYWPKLCLIQVSAPGTEAIIDPLAPGLSKAPADQALAPICALLANPDILKVFHAARQDMELFFHRLKVLPKPLFDSQIAGMVCGFGESIGYDALVKAVLNRDIDKSSRFTDWSRRPLTEKQLAYALADVTHLRDLYPILRDRMAADGRDAWVAAEVAQLEDPALYTLEPEDAWARLKIRNTNKRFLGVVKVLAAWREAEAQRRDVPRARIIKDDALLEIASSAPRTKEDMEQLRGVPRGFAGSQNGAAVLDAVARGLELPKEEIPKFERSQPPPQGIGPLMDLLRVLLKKVCEDHEVAPKLVATTSDLERIAADDEADVPALQGWRRDIFGAAALDLKNGRLALSAQGRGLVLVPLDR